MGEVKRYNHDIFHKPGDEGYCEHPGQSDGAPMPVKNFLGGPNEPELGAGTHVQRPGQEGSQPTSGLVQGSQSVPPAPLDAFLQGPEVRKTRVMPASGANPTPGMPGAA